MSEKHMVKLVQESSHWLISVSVRTPKDSVLIAVTGVGYKTRREGTPMARYAVTEAMY